MTKQYPFSIGVMVDSFRQDFEASVKKAAAMGAQGLQMYCVQGQFAPENFSAARRREVLDIVKSHGMVFSAICGDLGMGFGDAARNPELIEKSYRIMELAKELESNVVTTHIGVVPANPAHPRYAIMQDACNRLAAFADSIGSKFAIETGPEPSTVLRPFLDSLSAKGVAVNLDPANLAMVVGEKAVDAVKNLAPYIVHTHAKDGVKLRDANPEHIYNVTERPEHFGEYKYFREVPLGEGSVCFPTYLQALREVGYTGFLTVEREVGDTPERDIGAAVDFLKNIMEGM